MANCNLPIIVIDSYGSPIPDEPKILGRMQIFDRKPPHPSTPTRLSAEPSRLIRLRL
jgi:hypothetical protein